MCTNVPLVDSVECMEDLVDCFKDFVKKSLILMSVTAGAILVMTMYALKIVAHSMQPNTASTLVNLPPLTNVLPVEDVLETNEHRLAPKKSSTKHTKRISHKRVQSDTRIDASLSPGSKPSQKDLQSSNSPNVTKKSVNPTSKSNDPFACCGLEPNEDEEVSLIPISVQNTDKRKLSSNSKKNSKDLDRRSCCSMCCSVPK